MKTCRAGFTLLELLVAAALAACASVVVAGAFAAGLRVFERTRDLEAVGETVMAAELIERDLRNAVPFRLAGLKGERSWVEIPVAVGGARVGAGATGLGVIRYERGSRGAGIDRTTFTYVPPGRIEQGRERVADPVDSLEFSFAGASGAWVETWNDPTNLPGAVKIAWVCGQKGGKVEFSRTIVLPCGR